MQGFSKDQIDNAHRTSWRSTSKIIKFFYKKCDKNVFFGQKYKVKTLRSNQFSDDAAEEEQHLESYHVELTQRVYIKESLTKEDRERLKLAREEAKKLKYKYKDYTIKGEVQVNKNESSDYWVIWSKSDVQKIT